VREIWEEDCRKDREEVSGLTDVIYEVNEHIYLLRYSFRLIRMQCFDVLFPFDKAIWLALISAMLLAQW